MLRRPASLLLSCLMAAASTGVVRGADTSTPLPAEPNAFFLPGAAYGAVVVDIDGDGSRDIVRLVPETSQPGVLAVDAWRPPRRDPDAAWIRLGEAALDRAASVDELITDLPAQRHPMRPVGIGEPARFIVWNDGVRDRLLVATIATSVQPVPCCLTVWEVVSAGRAGLRLKLLLSTQDNAVTILAANLDGDRADELFVAKAPAIGAPNEVPIRLYDWDGRRFDEKRGIVVAPPGWEAFAIADSDGRPGGEIAISADPISGPQAILHRIWLARGKLRQESWAVRARGAVASFDAGHGARMVVVPPELGSTLIVRWPPGGSIQYEAGGSDVGRLLGVFGAGDGTRILIAGHDGGGVRITNPRLLPIPSPPANGVVTALVAAGAVPYIGPLPGGIDGRPAFIARGQLIDRPDRSALLAPLQTRPMAALPGVTPIGEFGTRDRYMALLHAAADPSRIGGQLDAPLLPLAARVSVAPSADVLAPEADQALDPTFSAMQTGAVSVRAHEVLTREPSLVATFDIPLGTRLLVATGSGQMTERPLALQREDQAQLQIDAPPDEDRFDLRVIAVTPAGHGYAGRWNVEVLGKPPPLSADVPFAPLSLDVPLSGRTLPQAEVTVDGQSVDVRDGGMFTTRVAAGVLPTDVQIVATDPVGNSTTTVVSVVGLVDYRQLPWIPIVVVLTMVAAVALYLRTPHPRPAAPRAPDDDARLEELD